ncbi:MAG: L-serine ammonia-lyase, iron-sulfur-dependent, subunit alpha [Lachnospiraceae bacterium]|nr:L-serine ammonia-lyase, iron-sulfur-dependent, subunit alpha [Lachnospiraceae bacterium]
MYDSLLAIVKRTKETNTPFWEVVCDEDCNEQGITREASFRSLSVMYRAMKEADSSYQSSWKSASGMVGTEGEKMRVYRAHHQPLTGSFMSLVSERALKSASSNACMKRIVAAPTAGSCGVLPAVLISLQERDALTDEQMVQALFVAGGIGGVIAHRASLSGAQGGCQAEVGAASAMAAGAAVYLAGGDDMRIVQACAIALKSLLGLACDPVAGLVEVPCVKRNVIGAVNALSAADLALAGIDSVIPADEVIDAMGRIGAKLPEEIRETGIGGLAGTPTGVSIRNRLKGGVTS